VTRGEEIDSNLVTTITANADGTFTLGTLPHGRFEIRASMAGREVATAYLERTGLAPQWMGRGLRVGLSLQGKGCSRIYPAGLDDTDCGRLDCGRLPAGEMKIIHADGTPLISKRLLFYRHSKERRKSPEFVLTTGADGSATTASAHGCYDIFIDHPRQIHLCFRAAPVTDNVTVVLAPDFR
jgi:hypothetical protein